MRKAISITLLAAALAACKPVAQEQPQERWRLTQAGVERYDAAGKASKVTIALPDWQWAGEPYACPPDLALGPRGEVVVTSNVLPTLWRIDPETLRVSVHRLQLDADADKDVGFSKISYSVKEGAFFAVSELQGSVWRIDPLLRTGQKTKLSEPIRAACGRS